MRTLWRQDDGTEATAELLLYIHDMLKKLGPQRAFYIIEANMDKGKIIKFGLAGIERGYAWGRINDYRLMYGLAEHDRSNKCMGFKIHYLGVTEYDPKVQPKDSAVWALELHLKQKYGGKKNSSTAVGDDKRRGFERVSTEYLEEILDIVKNSRGFKDMPTPSGDAGAVGTRSKSRIICADEKLKLNCYQVPVTRRSK